jgi:hypothetical protein
LTAEIQTVLDFDNRRKFHVWRFSKCRNDAGLIVTDNDAVVGVDSGVDGLAGIEALGRRGDDPEHGARGEFNRVVDRIAEIN